MRFGGGEEEEEEEEDGGGGGGANAVGASDGGGGAPPADGAGWSALRALADALGLGGRCSLRFSDVIFWSRLIPRLKGGWSHRRIPRLGTSAHAVALP